MALISVGIDHEHASLDLLERATVPEHEWAKMLRTLVSHRNIHEAVFVSTCLRTEVVAVIDRFHGAIDEITDTLAEATGLAPIEFEDRLTVNFEHDVAHHLFSVAAGLKSVVPGEFEILGQLRRALDLAVEEHSAGNEVTDIFQRAIASGPVSYTHLDVYKRQPATWSMNATLPTGPTSLNSRWTPSAPWRSRTPR